MAVLHMMPVFAGYVGWQCWLCWLDIMADYVRYAVWL
jgi:hypothetical protein